MPPKKIVAPPSKPTSSRQRTMTNKQQQLLAQKLEKEVAAKQRALTDAVRSEQRLEEINGFHKGKLPELPDTDNLEEDVESEDNDDEEQDTPFSSVTLPPIIKTKVRNGHTLVYRVPSQDTQAMDQEIPSATHIQSHGISESAAAPRKKKALVRRVIGDSSSSSYPSMIHDDAPSWDTLTHRHEDSEPLNHSHRDPAAPETKRKDPSERKRKEAPAISTSPETTVVTKKVKIEGSGTRGRVRTADFDDLTRSVIEETISIYRAQISSAEPFPERTEDRDTIKQAWLEVCTSRDVRVELEEDVFKLIVGRASQARGYVKTTSRPYFISAFKIDSLGSKREIRDSVEQLLEGARFIYKDPESKTGIFRAPLIQTIVNKVWFKNKEDDGVIHPEFSENDALSMVTMAFVLTVIENNLDEWVTGEHVDVPFTATTYKSKYCAHFKRITDFEKKTHNANIIPRLLKHILKAARKHAKAEGAGAQAQASVFSDAEIEAAKQEWIDLVLSDDE